MAKATVTLEVIKRDIKNAPPDGFVELKPLDYGSSLQKRDMASRMTLEAQRRGASGDGSKMIIDTYQRNSRFYEFSRCIVDHNLEDENGSKLNFSDIKTLDKLDPKVGEEIERYLDELNQDQTVTTVDSVGNVVDAPETEVFAQPSAVA